MRALTYTPPREPGNIIRIIRARCDIHWPELGAAFTYLRCVHDADLEKRARAIVRTVLDAQAEADLHAAATRYIRKPHITRIAYIATLIRRLGPVAAPLALLANGHDAPCVTRPPRPPVSKPRPSTSTLPPSPRAAART